MENDAMRRAIERKRDGAELSGRQWDTIVSSYMDGAIDDAQMAALAMACVWRGLTIDEATALTAALVDSGQTLDHEGFVVDKHSSGGVADVVSLVAVPLVAACGVRVAKLSGRALGHTGGTIDKLEALEGFDATLAPAEFAAVVQRVGCAIVAQSDAFVPADRRLYHLRDRTGTVPCIGLIAASVVSKKVAGGASAFAFDVKCGTGAFIKDPGAAIDLARTLIEITKHFGRAARAVVSDMNEPLGRSIGTGIEIVEARELLSGAIRTGRARDLSLRVAALMLELAKIADADALARETLESGSAYERFVAMIEAQGSSRRALEHLQIPAAQSPYRAERSGYVHAVDGGELGDAARVWSAHEAVAGIRLRALVGDRVERGDVLADVYGAHASHERLRGLFHIREEPVAARPLVLAEL